MTASEHFFHKAPENYNCAQAILKGFEQEFSVDNSQIEAFRAFGGGRAPLGVCGALFAAQQLLPHEASNLQTEFTQRCGSAYCRELKTQQRISCTEAVKTADTLLRKFVTKK
ncbi:MAG: C-GCAxxG-C-C family protein [Bacteroidales bacterium]|jgi:hypothetical protein|nr:C-GCAxxG-C-C family protein [Bacteroidales bacterium]